jgi:hypothetical protein
VNAILVRFADEQTMYMLMFSVGTAMTMKIADPSLLVFYWLLISPAPRLLAFPSQSNVYDIVPRLVPFNIHSLMEGMEKFLEPASKGQRIFMAFSDPAGVYENIFDRQRLLPELIEYVATQKGIHFMPDWWAVFELNYEGAPNFWGRDVSSVCENVKRWKADFVIVYLEDAGLPLDLNWEMAGFEPVRRFAWSDYIKEVADEYKGKLPDWWLLKIPSELNEQAVGNLH